MGVYTIEIKLFSLLLLILLVCLSLLLLSLSGAVGEISKVFFIQLQVMVELYLISGCNNKMSNNFLILLRTFAKISTP